MMSIFFVIFLLFLSLATLSGCGGEGSSSDTTVFPPNVSSSVSSVALSLPDECILQPQVVVDAQAPVISLHGDRVVTIPLGATYIDAGATAIDQQDGDLSYAIKITGLDKIDTNIVADYLIRYDVVDVQKHAAQSQHRILRVNNGTPPKHTKRVFHQSTSPLGFLEHLPTFLGSDPHARYPLIIYAHGWEHFVQQSPPGNDRLDGLLYGANIYRVFDENLWNDSRPFVVLEPQRCMEVGDVEWQQVDQFIDWALAVYPIDPDRIYMMGLSAGGYFTYRYPVLFPNRLAAIAPMSAGGPVESAQSIASFCAAMKEMPIWAFHGDDDRTVPLSESLNTFDILNKTCTTRPIPAPLLTVVTGGSHVIINLIDDDSYIGHGDSKYTVQKQSLYDWFLQYSRVKNK